MSLTQGVKVFRAAAADNSLFKGLNINFTKKKDLQIFNHHVNFYMEMQSSCQKSLLAPNTRRKTLITN